MKKGWITVVKLVSILLVYNKLNCLFTFFSFLGGDTFNAISSLIRHRKCVHLGVKRSCPICHKEMSKNVNMKEHIDTVHKGLKNHSCEICGKKFGRQTNLSRHKKTSHNIFPPKKSNLVHEEYNNLNPLDLHKN